MSSTDLIIEYSGNPPNKGILEHATIRHRESNGVCADVVEVCLVIKDNALVEFSFDGYMSIIATACTAIVGEILIGTSLDEILTLNESFIHENIWTDISPRRRFASLIWLLAIKNAIHTWRKDGIGEDFSDIVI